MALIKCTECGKVFSDKAPACPNCGCPTDCIINPNPIAGNDTPNILEHIYASYPNNKIAAIKEYRKVTGCSLSESKKIIQNFYAFR